MSKDRKNSEMGIIDCVAREIAEKYLNGAFVTLERDEATRVLRLKLNSQTARLSPKRAEMLDTAFLDHGVRCFPRFQDTSTGDSVRLIRSTTYAARLLDVMQYPSTESDRELAHILTKLGGRWQWSGTGDAAAA